MWRNEEKKKKKKERKESRCEPAMGGKKGGGENVIKERKRSDKLLVFDVTTQSIRSHKFHLIVKLPYNSTQVLENISNLFPVSVTYYSLWWEWSDENKIWKHIQTSYYSVRPTIFDWRVMETEWWVMEALKSK